MNDIYGLMKTQLNKNPQLLLTYFNVMILSKAFKLNKVLLLNNSGEIVSTTDKTEDANGLNASRVSTRPSSFSNEAIKHKESINSFGWSSSSSSSGTFQFDYDADGELSVQGRLTFIILLNCRLNGEFFFIFFYIRKFL